MKSDIDAQNELRRDLIARCEERIANGKRLANEAHKERDWEGSAIARHAIGENERFLEKLLRQRGG